MSCRGAKKVSQEIRRYCQSPIEGVRLIPELTTANEAYFEMDGPIKTPYEEGVFTMKLVFDEDYPIKPPKGYFLTRIFHPNISTSGEVCVNVLSRDWKAELGLSHVLMVIRCLLIQPFAESALDEVAGMMLMEGYEEYFTRAQLFTSIHAKKAKRKIASCESTSPKKEENPLTPNLMSNRTNERTHPTAEEETFSSIKTKQTSQGVAKSRTGLKRL